MRTLLIATLAAVSLSACVAEPEPEPPLPSEGPVVPYVEPELVATDWWIGLLDNTSDDVILDAIEGGGLDRPSSGTDAQGTFWLEVEADESGSVGTYNAAFFYVVSERAFDADERLIVATSGSSSTWVGDRRQTGYFYGDGRARVATVPRDDEARVVARGLGGRDSRIQVFRTDDELWINASDLTAPEFVVGDPDERWLGAPVLNLTRHTALDVVARVVENEFFEATAQTVPAIGAGASTQVGFLLRPKRAATQDEIDAEETWPVTLQVGSPSAEFSYQRAINVGLRPAGANHWRTFRSPIDGSIQQYGVLPPSDFDPDRAYGLILSLHGAGVAGRGQSGSYSAKDWAYIVAPTNRHPFGFDWEEWGRFNALATMDDAKAAFGTDPTRQYLTGHSMGGHGTWHVGVTTPGRFATVAPSAGWESFYNYPQTSSRPSGDFARARAHSDTREYLDNLAQRGVFIIHGDADDNVPVTQARTMRDLLTGVTDDLQYHEQPGAGHWWDADGDEPGADCVDWEPMIDWAQEHTLDPYELDFSFRSPLPSYSPTHSYATIRSASSTTADVVLSSTRDGDTVRLDTVNARSLTLDGDALGAAGIDTVVVDGASMAVTAGPMPVGPQDGKRPDVYGPFNQAFRRPFCFVTPEDGEARNYAAYLSSYWQVLGNGRACMLTSDELTDAVRAAYQLVWIGVDADTVNPSVAATWDDDEVDVGGDGGADSGVLTVFPRGDGLDAAMATTRGDERLLYSIMPFSSRSGLPDWFVWGGEVATGFYAPDWSAD
jgi:poly(3-hydroxybutyrate) depolymerase